MFATIVFVLSAHLGSVLGRRRPLLLLCRTRRLLEEVHSWPVGIGRDKFAPQLVV
jgi:hypothetical protein